MRTAFRERSSRKIGAIVFVTLQYFATRVKNCLRRAYCMQRGMFPFECFLVRLNEQKTT